MPKQGLICLIACAVVLSGCHWIYPTKRKCNFPTDICKGILCCTGEEAVFCCPCDPAQSFYGHKPTCWSDWPTSGAAWRDIHCQPFLTECNDEHNGAGVIEVVPSPPGGEVKETPARADGLEELPPLLMPDSSLLPGPAVR
jgi:hypothetical protein